MIKPLREAYENYERMRLEEEAVKAAAAAESPETSTVDKGLEAATCSTDGKMFRDKKKASRPANKDQEKLFRTSIKSQVLMQHGYFENTFWGGGMALICDGLWGGGEGMAAILVVAGAKRLPCKQL